MEMHDAWFFIGVFAFIFLIWVATGGPLHPIAFTGPEARTARSAGRRDLSPTPASALWGGGSNISLPGSSSGESTQNNSETPALGGSTFGPLSPYRGVVRMSHYISGAGSADPGNEYIEISVAQNAGFPIDISGWALSSDVTGNIVSIPKGTEVPTSGTINAAENIVLTPGTRAILISGRSPIGASFRENKCIGYFSTFQKFSPPLPQNCPTPSDELSSLYGAGYVRDVACIDYVNKLSRCQVALSPPVTVSGACQNFMVQYLNYNGCVTAHQNDTDFKGDTWRIYLGRTSPLWRANREVVKLWT